MCGPNKCLNYLNLLAMVFQTSTGTIFATNGHTPSNVGGHMGGGHDQPKSSATNRGEHVLLQEHERTSFQAQSSF